MKVKLRYPAAGPNGTSLPGAVIEVSDEDGKRLIEAGEAYSAGGEPETAELGSAKESKKRARDEARAKAEE